jgi:dephospho-CoA kinase
VLTVALTGNIGAGKSTVASLFEGWGATLIDADRLVREVQAPGSPIVRAIADRFGSEVVTSEGALRREALRRLVMGDPEALAVLNRIVHPAVLVRRTELEQQARQRGDRIVVSDIPLLFEAADPSAFDVIVLVDAPEALRRARLVAERGLSEPEANEMIAAQAPSGPKRSRSTYVIDNDGDLAALERAAASVWEALLARA